MIVYTSFAFFGEMGMSLRARRRWPRLDGMEAGAAVRALAAITTPVSSTVPLFLGGMSFGFDDFAWRFQ
jgi:hypothetical protein